VILPDALQRAWNLTIGYVRKSLLRCPSCARAMNVVPTDGVIIDMCRPCQLMWFDPGELDALPHRSADEMAAEERSAAARGRLLGRGDLRKLLGQRGSYPVAS
jgi:Zn-finger nucleic acid-binding protein